MRLWTIWVQASDGATWLESAWDDESSAENPDGYATSIDAAQKVAEANKGVMRVLAVDLPDDAVFDMFKPKAVTAMSTEPQQEEN